MVEQFLYSVQCTYSELKCTKESIACHEQSAERLSTKKEKYHFANGGEACFKWGGNARR